MRRLVVAALLVIVGVVGIVGLAEAAPGQNDPWGTIVLDQTGPLSFGDSVTFTTTHTRLKGSQWPMVYVECRSVDDGAVLYGQLDQPDAQFLLGGGWSPWWEYDPRPDALCQGYLYAYSRQGDVALLATTFTNFAVSG